LLQKIIDDNPQYKGNIYILCDMDDTLIAHDNKERLYAELLYQLAHCNFILFILITNQINSFILKKFMIKKQKCLSKEIADIQAELILPPKNPIEKLYYAIETTGNSKWDTFHSFIKRLKIKEVLL
jgi:hypothetical protein